MSKTKLRVLLPIGFLAAIAIIAYLGKANQLGFFSDDWYLLFGGVNYGPERYRDIFSIDRPYRAHLQILLYQILGTKITLYYYLALLVRFVGGLSLFWLLKQIWKERSLFCALAAAIFLVYPGFLEQPNAMDYMAHQVSLTAVILSIGLSIRCVTVKNIPVKVVLFLLSSGLAVISYLLMEYFIAMEGYRFLFLVFLLWSNRNEGFWKKIWRILKSAIPFLTAPAIFAYWRIFRFEGTRAATDLDLIYSNLSDSLLVSLLATIKRFVIDAGEVLVGAYVTPFSILVARLSSKEFAAAIAVGLLAVAVAILFIKLHKPPASTTDESQNNKQLLVFCLVALLGALLCLLPINIAKRDVSYLFFSRFSLLSALGVAVFLAGVGTLLPKRILQTSFFSVVLFTSVVTQYANNIRFSVEWAETQRFWQNMIWRVPNLENGTTLTGFRTAPIYEGYMIWSPVNLLYREKSEEIKLAAEVLNKDVLMNIAMKVPYEKNQRSMIVTHDYNKTLLFSMPTADSCLRLIDNRQIELSVYDDPLIALAAPYSSTSRVSGDDAIQYDVFARIFRINAVDETWCYFYEQAALARQFEDWEKVADLAAEADTKNLHPFDSIEWMPFIQAYAYLGRTDEAGDLIQALNEMPYYRAQACGIFESKELSGEAQIDAGNLYLAEAFCED